MFCAPGLVFGGAESIGSRSHVFLFSAPDALGIVENESRSAKHENGIRRPRYRRKRVRERKT
jgi:hypothetical protein